MKRFFRSLARQDWTTVLVELLVVIVGILLALQVDQWADGREHRTSERTYLSRLKEDLLIERARIDDAQGYAINRLAAVMLLERFAQDPSSKIEDAKRVPWAIETASWRSFPRINNFVYGELQSSGRMSLIRSVTLRRALAEHYAQIQHDARVGEDREAEERFDLVSAGLLTMDELMSIEDAEGNHARLNVSAPRARAIVKAFATRRAAADALPGLAQHHRFNLRVINDMRIRVDALIKIIDNELEPTR